MRRTELHGRPNRIRFELLLSSYCCCCCCCYGWRWYTFLQAKNRYQFLFSLVLCRSCFHFAACSVRAHAYVPNAKRIIRTKEMKINWTNVIFNSNTNRMKNKQTNARSEWDGEWAREFLTTQIRSIFIYFGHTERERERVFTRHKVSNKFISKQIQKEMKKRQIKCHAVQCVYVHVYAVLLCKPNWKLNTSDNRISRVLWFVISFPFSQSVLLLNYYFIFFLIIAEKSAEFLHRLVFGFFNL